MDTSNGIRITGGRVFLNGSFVEDDLCIAEGAFSSSAGAGARHIDASGCSIIPGLVDIHFHGCRNHDFCEGTDKAIHTIAAWEASRGITSICPATMTYPEDTLAAIMDTAASFAPSAHEASLVGINMEGPFISPNKVGAQNPRYVQAPDAAMARRLIQRSNGLVKLIDIAPEVEGALPFTEALHHEVRISIAHTNATYEQAVAAFDAGACGMTHLFNAMPGLGHRDPGPIAAAIEREDVTAEIIADGVHIHPAMVRMAFDLFGPDRMILISDSMMATGMEDGEYQLGGQPVTVRGNRATLHDRTIAGSATDLAACLRISVMHMGIPLASAVRAATENPARAIGIEDRCGRIEVGRTADCVILDADLNVRDVIVRGTLLANAFR